MALAGLIVPPALETAGEQLLTSITPATTAAAVPERIRSLGLVVEPRLESGVTLDGTTYARSATAWYGFASPAQLDTIEYALLEGEEGVRVDVRPGWNTDGIEVRARLDIGAAALDHRGLAKNSGA